MRPLHVMAFWFATACTSMMGTSPAVRRAQEDVETAEQLAQQSERDQARLHESMMKLQQGQTQAEVRQLFGDPSAVSQVTCGHQTRSGEWSCLIWDYNYGCPPGAAFNDPTLRAVACSSRRTYLRIYFQGYQGEEWIVNGWSANP